MLAARWVEDARRAGGHGANLLRERIQWDVLAGMHKEEAFRYAAFIGGTSLRLLHGLPRFSEDLDFSAIRDRVGIDDLRRWMSGAASRLKASGLDVEIKLGRGDTSVLKAIVAVPGILKAAGLSPMASQKLNVKVEVDSRPPTGWVAATEIRSSPHLIAVKTFAMPSLMAGKLHALLARPWTKGRDWYDLIWYLGRGVQPNLELLQASLDQMPSRLTDDAATWRESVAKTAADTDWRKVHADVGPFLEDSSELAMLSSDTVHAMLGVPLSNEVIADEIGERSRIAP